MNLCNIKQILNKDIIFFLIRKLDLTLLCENL